MAHKLLLAVTAIGEGATGLLLLLLPSLVLALLLGVEAAPPIALVVARILGVALLAIGVACWHAWGDAGSRARAGLLAAVLWYDAGAAAVLVYAGTALGVAGVALWPAVVVHVLLAVWTIVCLRRTPSNAA